ncbi:hypothetical protein AKJ16_DCAP06495 [Drosera capensis]
MSIVNLLSSHPGGLDFSDWILHFVSSENNKALRCTASLKHICLLFYHLNYSLGSENILILYVGRFKV